MTLTQENIDNLIKLAAYLEGLPADYHHFDMAHYFDGYTMGQASYVKHNEPLTACGTAACALGHGPEAGIPFRAYEWNGGDINWGRYSLRFVGRDDYAFHFLFASDWNDIDNTHHGAAARIRYVLDGGKVPQGGPDKEMIKLYQSYRVDKENNYG